MNENFAQRFRHQAVIFAFFFPSVLTWGYLVLGSKFDPNLQKGIYGAGKVIQFLFPVIWIFLLARISQNKKSKEPSEFPNITEDPATDPTNRTDLIKPIVKTSPTEPNGRIPRSGSFRFLIEGSLFGMAVLGLILFAFYNFDFLSESLNRLKEELVPRLTRMGVARPIPYIILGAFYCVIHSGLEEYYWRWFVFGEMKKMQSASKSAVLSAMGFTLHHIILLGTYFGFASFLCWFCSLGVCIGGAYWAWLYQRSKRIYAPWLSHAFIDLAIFIVGYQIIISGK